METGEKKADVQDFNRRAATYEDSPRQDIIFDRVQRAVLELAQNEDEPKTVLDVGCGTGRLLRKTQEKWPNARLIGVDPAEGMITKPHNCCQQLLFMFQEQNPCLFLMLQ